MGDPRRHIPGTDTLLSDPRIAAASAHIGHSTTKRVIHEVQHRARSGHVDPHNIVDTVLAELPDATCSLRPVLNATGVLLHTNLGRAPLSPAATDALHHAAGTTNVELNLDTGDRGGRGRATHDALHHAVPAAEAVHIVNNGAAALLLAATALAQDREIVLARGEMIEIGDGFRIPELLESSGAHLHEIGTTNRVTLDDYEHAIGPHTACILKVHPANFVITGYTASVPVDALHELGRALNVPMIVDIGSGLLQPHPLLPDEPDATTTLHAGADLVTASGDKLLGGPQCGLLLGSAPLVRSLRRHPIARALRVDKLTLASLEATLRGPSTPLEAALRCDTTELRHRATTLAADLKAAGIDATAIESTATLGGGAAPGHALPSAAITVPQNLAAPLRTGNPPVVGRTESGRHLLDLRALPPDQDPRLFQAILAAGGQLPS